MKTAAEYRRERQAEYEDVAWRADAVCALERLWDEPRQTYKRVAAMVGVTPAQLRRFLAFREVPPDAGERIRAWADKQDVGPAQPGFVAILALVRRYPPQEREDAMRRLHLALEKDAAKHGVTDWGLAGQPMGWKPPRGVRSLAETMGAPVAAEANGR